MQPLSYGAAPQHVESQRASGDIRGDFRSGSGFGRTGPASATYSPGLSAGSKSSVSKPLPIANLNLAAARGIVVPGRTRGKIQV